MARSTQALWALADCVSPFQPVEQGRYLGPNCREAPAAARRGGSDRLEPVVRGRQLGASTQIRCWSIEKRGVANEPADHALGRSRGGWGTKFHIVTDGQGTPLAAGVTAGQRHESTQFEFIVEAVPLRQGQWPERLSGDKGYSAKRIRQWLGKRNIGDAIPARSDERKNRKERLFLQKVYRRRNVVERCVGWLKEARRIATRFEKLAINYLAMLKLAMIGRYLRLATRTRERVRSPACPAR